MYWRTRVRNLLDFIVKYNRKGIIRLFYRIILFDLVESKGVNMNLDMEKEIVDKVNLHIDSVTEELIKIIEIKISDNLKEFNKLITKRLNDLEEKLEKLGTKGT